MFCNNVNWKVLISVWTCPLLLKQFSIHIDWCQNYLKLNENIQVGTLSIIAFGVFYLNWENLYFSECHTSYTQSICKVLILSAVWGIGPTVAYVLNPDLKIRSLRWPLNVVFVKLTPKNTQLRFILYNIYLILPGANFQTWAVRWRKH